jgi:hypothetical protein
MGRKRPRIVKGGRTSWTSEQNEGAADLEEPAAAKRNRAKPVAYPNLDITSDPDFWLARRLLFLSPSNSSSTLLQDEDGTRNQLHLCEMASEALGC